jgi:hypothetical protein
MKEMFQLFGKILAAFIDFDKINEKTTHLSYLDKEID